ncbi:MAG: putative bifunctional diguanylate cyclase/phosphodiesterase [Bdellovibrio bacteriovorus]
MAGRGLWWVLALFGLGALILIPLVAQVGFHWLVALGLALLFGLGILYALHIGTANRRLLAVQKELTQAQVSQRRAFEDLEAANRGLEAERAKLRSITETAVDGIFLLDGEGRIAYANPAAERILGYGPGELLGRDAHLSLATPELRDQAHRAYRRYAESGTGPVLGTTRPLQAVRRDGSQVPVELSIAPLSLDGQQHAIGVMRDVSARLRMEQELHESRGNLQSLMQENRTGILVLDARGRVQFANAAAESLLPRGPQGLLGTDFALSPVANGPSGSAGEIPIKRSDGTEGTAAVAVTETRWQGALARLVMLHDITERKAAEQRMQQLAFEDGLTGLPNRELFSDRLEQAIELAQRERKGLALLFMDLDRFKQVNDSLGHGAGDHLLRSVAQRLRALPRASDTIARMGGDEFTAIFYDVPDVVAAEGLARRVLQSFAEPFDLEGAAFVVTPSIGITLYPMLATDPDVLLRQADSAMYEVKRWGGNAFRLYSEQITLVRRSRLALEKELRAALRDGDFALFYQPQVALDSGRCMGCEVLLRWSHPTRGLLLPPGFLPLLESTGLILDVGAWVLDEACRQLRQWLDQGEEPPTLSVNISAIQAERSDIHALVAQALARHRVEPRYLALEIAETTLFSRLTEVADLVRDLAELGVEVHIDNFGTGYASLAMIKQLPVKAVKLDGALVTALGIEASDEALVRATLTMAQGLGKRVIAAGVETPDQLARLRRLRCDLVQGFLVGRPMPPAALGAWQRQRVPVARVAV